MARLSFLTFYQTLLSPYTLARELFRWIRPGKRRGYELEPLRVLTPLSPQGASSSFTVALVGSTMGELSVMEALTKELVVIEPAVRVLWALRDRRAVAVSVSRHPEQSVTYWPSEFAPVTMRWVRKFRQQATIMIGAVWYPNLAISCQLHNCAFGVVDGHPRAPDGPIKRLYARWTLSATDLVRVQSDDYELVVRRYAPKHRRITVTGSLKASALGPQPASDNLLKWLLAGDRPILVAGSLTDAVEDKFVLDAFTQVEETCTLLLAPRHPDRGGEVEAACAKRGLNAGRRSKGEADVGVMILDTLGELSACYEFCVAAFVGGTISGYGHNVLEPASNGVPVSFGPVRGRHGESQDLLEAAGIGFRVNTPAELAAHWSRTLADEGFRLSVEREAKKLLSEESVLLRETAEAILTVARR